MFSGAVQIAASADPQLELVTVSEGTDIVSGPGLSAIVFDVGESRLGEATLVRFPGTYRQGAALALELGVPSDLALPAPGVGYAFVKRALDIVVALVALILLAPLFLAVTLVIRSTTAGPTLFSQRRCGHGGRPFRLLKFRTMVTDAERIRHELAHLNEMSGPMFKVRLDPRVTRVGRFLRKSSVDELPQLLNVLRGDMTLVGPRPSIISEVEAFTDLQRRRLDVKPGLTCLWQVSGRSDLSFDEWVALDLAYIEQRSFWLDLRILVRTVPAVLSGRGAY